jgi:hypothetical protein
MCSGSRKLAPSKTLVTLACLVPRFNNTASVIKFIEVVKSLGKGVACGGDSPQPVVLVLVIDNLLWVCGWVHVVQMGVNLQHPMSQEGHKDQQGQQPPEPLPVHPPTIQ